MSVGTWLRDYKLLADALRLLKRAGMNVPCDIVADQKYRELFSDLENVHVHSGIPLEHLLSLYRTASVAVLPLTDGVANTALLEALSCGVPLVSSDIPGVREYTHPEGCLLVDRSSPVQLSSAIASILRDNEVLQKMGQINAVHAEKFDWERVGVQMMQVYQRVCVPS